MTIDIPAMLKLAKEARESADKYKITGVNTITACAVTDVPALADAVEALAAECERLAAWQSSCEEIESDAIEINKRAEKYESQVEEYKSQLAAALNLAGQEGDRAQKAEARVKELEEKEPTWGKRMYALDRAEKAEARVAVMRERLKAAEHALEAARSVVSEPSVRDELRCYVMGVEFLQRLQAWRRASAPTKGDGDAD